MSFTTTKVCGCCGQTAEHYKTSTVCRACRNKKDREKYVYDANQKIVRRARYLKKTEARRAADAANKALLDGGSCVKCGFSGRKALKVVGEPPAVWCQNCLIEAAD